MEANSKRVVLTIDIPADCAVQDALAAAAEMAVRVNDGRISLAKPVARAVRVVLEMEVPEVTLAMSESLMLAAHTGYKTNAPFRSPAEVRQYFSRSVIESVVGQTYPGTDESLAAMAEAVIAVRSHCLF